MTRRFNVLAFIPLVVVFGLVALIFAPGLFRDNPQALPSVFVGKPAPELAAAELGALPTFDRQVLLGDGVKIVNFWASWCPPCRAEHPALIELAKDLPVYGINRDTDEAAALAFLQELGNPFEGVVHDPNTRKSIDWGVYGLPETFIIDGEGKVVLRFPGPIHRVMESTILPAIAEAKG